MILDLVCTKTVWGTMWLEYFQETLPKEVRNQVKNNRGYK